METLTLAVEPRTLTGRKTEALRANETVPGIVYGFEVEPTKIQFNRGDFTRLYRSAGTSSVVELNVGGSVVHALIQDIQKDPLTDFVTHVDFLSVNMKQKVEAEIALELVGESPAVKAGGTIVHSVDALEVEALPTKLVKQIDVDISKLVTFDDTITVADLTIPEGIEVKMEADTVIATVQPPRTEDEMEALDAPVQDAVAEQQEALDKEKASEEKSENE